MNGRMNIPLSIAAFVLLASVVQAEPAKTGFLVIAPDRGFLGNQEVAAVFGEFKKSYAPAALALVGRDYNGVGSEYSNYLARALADFKQAGATDILAIPLFLSKADPILQKVITHLPTYPGANRLRWAEPLIESHLARQMLLDRVEALSREPEQERLLVVGFGATDETNEAALKRDLDRLLAYVTERRHFREARTAVYYDRAVRAAEEKNKAVDALITETAAKKGRTLLTLAAIGPKFDRSMALTAWFGEKFKELDIAYAGEELIRTMTPWNRRSRHCGHGTGSRWPMAWGIPMLSSKPCPGWRTRASGGSYSCGCTH
jgi:hypothetical protein